MKAQVQMQFNWIFVLVAGALILMLFFGFTMRQRSVAQTKIAAIVVNDIDTIASGAGVSKGVAQTINFRSPVTFKCSKDCVCEFSVEGVSKDFDENLIFAPEEAEGEVVFWTLEWKAPYRVSNFLFIANPDRKFYFVYDTGVSAQRKKYFERMVPDEINHEFIKPNDIFKIEEKDVVFVLLSNKLSESNEKVRKNILQKFDTIKIIEIKSGAQGNYEGNIWDYVDSKAEIIEFHTIGLPMFIGLVFSDENMYNCNMMNAFHRMSFVNQVYLQRTLSFEDMTELKVRECSYLEAIDTLNDIQKIAEDLYNEFSFDKVKNLKTKVISLEQKNKKKVMESCPRIM